MPTSPSSHLQFRLEITGYERLVTYILKIEPDATGRAVVAREVLRYKRGAYGQPFHFLDFAHGKGYAITNEEDFSKAEEALVREEQRSTRPTSWPSRAWVSSTASWRQAPSA